MGMDGKNNVCSVIGDVVEVTSVCSSNLPSIVVYYHHSELVINFIFNLILCMQYYVQQSQSSNHMIAEAACFAIAELAVKLPPQITQPFAPRLYMACVECLQSDSWPIRDSACPATGRVIQHLIADSDIDEEMEWFFPKELETVLDLLCSHMQDSIPSIREHAAEGLGCLLRAQSKSVLEMVNKRVQMHFTKHLQRARKQRDAEKKQLQFIPAMSLARMKGSEKSDTSHSSNTSASSSSSLNPLSSTSSAPTSVFESSTNFDEVRTRGRAEGWSCGLDCGVGLSCSTQRISGR